MSTITGIIMFLIIMYAFFKWTRAEYTEKDLILIGGLWFEFIFGQFVMGHPWSKLFADYNILEGRVWGFMLLTVVVGPYCVGRYLLRHHSPEEK